MSDTVYSRKEYLRVIKRQRIMVKSAQIFFVLAFLSAWEISAGLEIIDPFIFSSPSRIFKAFITMARADLLKHVMYTVGETLVGFLTGAAAGFAISVALWYSSFAHRVFAPYLVVLNSLPKIALGPVIIVWAGAGAGAVVTMAVAISLIVTVMELSRGFAATDSNLITTVKSFGRGRARCFKKVVLPYNVPVLFQSLKVNIGLSLVGVIAGEFLVSKAGLGYLIVYAGQVFKMDVVMMSVVLLAFIAFGMYAAVGLAEKLAVKIINHV